MCRMSVILWFNTQLPSGFLWGWGAGVNVRLENGHRGDVGHLKLCV